MKKADKIVVAAVIALVCVTAAAAVVFHFRDRNDAANMRAVDLKMEQRLKAASASKIQQVSGGNFYEKLKAGAHSSILVIGDGIGQSDGSTQQNGWAEQLKAKIRKKYGSDIDVTMMTNSACDIEQAYLDYSRSQQEKPDCVVICEGKNDRKTPIKNFQMYYEGLIQKILASDPECAIIPIIENGENSDGNYTKCITDIAGNYSLGLADVRSAFTGAGTGKTKLVSDDGTPTDSGYQIYATRVFDTITYSVNSGQKTSGSSDKKSLYSQTDTLKNISFSTEPSASSGFSRKNGCFIASESGASISFPESDSSVIVLFSTSQNGGSFKAYVDDEFFTAIDTSDTGSTGYRLLSQSIVKGKHSVRIVVPTLKAGQTVTVYGAASY